MSRSNFRIKVDLSRFFDDVRRLSSVYVDNVVISSINDLKNHIAKIFNIHSPFHLLLSSGEYLPPNEKTEIIEQNETILVIPGTGLRDNLPPERDTVSEIVEREQCQANSIGAVESEVEESYEDRGRVNGLDMTGGDTEFLSVANTSQMDVESDSKPSLNTLDESVASDTSFVKNKRKRVRRTKSKKVTPVEEVVANDQVQSEYKKPKIIDSLTVSNRNHIRFRNEEDFDWQGYDSAVSNDSKRHNSEVNRNENIASSDKSVARSSLSNLLALREFSTPITYGRKKAENNIPQGNVINTYETKQFTVQKQPVSAKLIDSVTVDESKHPLIIGKAHVNDVIAFKTLKLGNDYSPVISDYIIGRTVQVHIETSDYTFRILAGKDEIAAPQGKFNLESDETEDGENDIMRLHWSNVLEPRLIHRP